MIQLIRFPNIYPEFLRILGNDHMEIHVRDHEAVKKTICRRSFLFHRPHVPSNFRAQANKLLLIESLNHVPRSFNMFAKVVKRLKVARLYNLGCWRPGPPRV